MMIGTYARWCYTLKCFYGSDPHSYGNNAINFYLNDTDQSQFSTSGSWDHTHPSTASFRVGDTGGTNGNGGI